MSGGKNVYLGLDLGTSGLKGVLADERMNLLANAAIDAPMICDGATREFEPEDFIDRAMNLIADLVRQYPGPASDIKAVSTASASGNTLFLDENDVPMGNVLSWTDRRIEDKIPDYLPGFDCDGVYEKVGWPFLKFFPLTHIAWFKKDCPEDFARVRRIAMSTEYLQFRLCGAWGTEPSAATTFYLQDQRKAAYAPEYLDYFGITPEMLPPILPERTLLGRILPEASRRTGLSTETKVILGSFDHPACARCMGALDEGNLLLSCGTSWAGLFVTKEREKAIRAGMLIDPYLRQEGNWAAIFAFTQYGEFINKRVAEYIDASDHPFDRFGALTQEPISESEKVYAAIADDADCRAKWAGLTPRQVAASIIYLTSVDVRRRMEELAKDGFRAEKIYMAGGPSQNSVWAQTLADVIEKPVYRLHRKFGGAVGAALMAAIGDGIYRDERDYFRDKKNEYSISEPNV